MKRWLKLLSLVLALSLIAGLIAGCGSKKDDEKEEADASEGNFIDLKGDFTDVTVTDNDSAINAVKSASDNLEMSDTAYDLKVTNVSKFDGETYYRMQQCYDGVPVYGKEVVLTVDGSGKPIALTSNMAKITEGSGAKEATGVDYTKLRDKVLSVLQTGDIAISDFQCVTQPETYYYTGDGTSARPCYSDVVSFKDNDNRGYEFRILFDCESYDFVDIDFVSTYVTVPASGTDMLGEKREFNAYKENGSYYMYDEDRDIIVVNANSNTVIRTPYYVDDNNNEYYYIDGKLYGSDEKEYQLNEDKTEVLDSAGNVVGKNLKEGYYCSGTPSDNLEISKSASTLWN